MVEPLSAALLIGGSIAGSALGSVSNSKAAKRQFEYQKQLQQQAADLNYNNSIKFAQNGYSATREGLEKGGYNPMLAVQNGASNASSFTSSGTAGSFDDMSPISSAVSNASDIANLHNNTIQAESVSDVNYANADKAKAEKAKIIEELPYVGKQAKVNYMKTAMESAKLENDIHYQNEYLNYLENLLKVQRELGQMGFANSKDVANIHASAQRYGSDISAKSTPFKYFADKIEKSGGTPYRFGKFIGDNFFRGLKGR